MTLKKPPWAFVQVPPPTLIFPLVRFHSAGQRRLLAAIAGSGTARAEFLGETLVLSGSALRTALSRLRARIGDEVITTDASGYRLAADIDAARSEQLPVTCATGVARLNDLDAALALWNGEALDEFSHEQWAQVETARLEELARVAVKTAPNC